MSLGLGGLKLLGQRFQVNSISRYRSLNILNNKVKDGDKREELRFPLENHLAKRSDILFITSVEKLSLTERYAKFNSYLEGEEQGQGQGRGKLSVFSFNYMLRGLSKSNSSLETFEHLFTRLKQNQVVGVEPDIHSYNLAMEGYFNYQRYEKALHLFQQLVEGRVAGVVPNIYSFNCTLKVYGKTQAKPNQFYQLLQWMEQFNVPPDIYTCTLGLDLASLHRDLELSASVTKLVERFSLKLDTLYFNSQLNHKLQLGTPYFEGVAVLDTMKRKLVEPNSDTFFKLLQLANQNGQLDLEGESLFQLMVQHKVVPCLESIHLLRYRYTNLQIVEKLSQNMVPVDIKLINRQLNYLVKHNFFLEALQLSNFAIQLGLTPTIHSYSILIEAYVKLNRLDKGLELYAELQLKKLTPDFFIHRSLLEGLGKKHGLHKAYQFYCKLKLDGNQTQTQVLNRYIGNSMLGLCVLESNLDIAKKVVDDMKYFGIQPDIRSYNCLLAIYANRNDSTNLHRVYENLLNSQTKYNLQPDYLTYTIRFKYYLRRKELQPSWKVYKQLYHSQFSLNCNFTAKLIQLATFQQQFDLGLLVYSEYLDYVLANFRQLKVQRNSNFYNEKDKGMSKYVFLTDPVVLAMVQLTNQSNRYLTLITHLKSLAQLTLSNQLPFHSNTSQTVTYNTLLLGLQTCLKFHQFDSFLELLDLFHLAFQFQLDNQHIQAIENTYQNDMDSETYTCFQRRVQK